MKKWIKKVVVVQVLEEKTVDHMARKKTSKMLPFQQTYTWDFSLNSFTTFIFSDYVSAVFDVRRVTEMKERLKMQFK